MDDQQRQDARDQLARSVARQLCEAECAGAWDGDPGRTSHVVEDHGPAARDLVDWFEANVEVVARAAGWDVKTASMYDKSGTRLIAYGPVRPRRP